MGNCCSNMYKMDGELVKINTNAEGKLIIWDRNDNLIFKGDGKFTYSYHNVMVFPSGIEWKLSNGTFYYKNGKPMCDEGDFYKNKYNGSLKNGKRVGKLYHSNGEVKYIGEFEKGKKHGKGTLYNKCEQIIFDGVFNNDKYEYGRLYFDGEVKYNGDFENNKIKNGEYYEYIDGKKILRYKGDFENDKYHGFGTCYNDDGSIYEDGQWKKGYYKVGYAKPKPREKQNLLN